MNKEYTPFLYIERIFDKNTVSKLTINPNSGRVSAKFKRGISEFEKRAVEKMAEQLTYITHIERKTHRGVVKETKTGYKCILRTEDKKHKLRLEVVFGPV